jgi:hypothetical protein
MAAETVMAGVDGLALLEITAPVGHSVLASAFLERKATNKVAILL